MLFWTVALLAAVSASSPLRVKGVADKSVLAPSLSGVDSYRLPTSIVPLHYDLQLHPNPGGDFRYNGSVAIVVRAVEPTFNITFHVKDLEVVQDSVEVVSSSKSGAAFLVTEQEADERRNFYTLTLNSSLTAGEIYILRLDFSGYHNSDKAGFYRSSYRDQNNNTVWLVTTQFEVTDARRAFPCFDEPALKATFSISIAVPEGLHARSNMPVASKEPEAASGRTWYHFQQTPMPMSTYLVAFIVSDFTNVTDDYVSVWEQPAYQSQGWYAAGVALRVIEAMENFTQVKYFLPKMDEVAVPDLSPGAMENYALVTFREDQLLVQEDVSKSMYVQMIVTGISHEFAHHWFGDLVGPRWWSYTWLNEGFATYFEYNLAALLEPSWKLDELFVTSQVQSALVIDSDNHSQPMTVVPLEASDNLEDVFSGIAYNKGASVIRMIEHVLTHDTFKKGLNTYLNAHGNDTATDQDLFDALIEQYKADFPSSALDLQAFLVSWVRQAGYPLITVTRNYTDQTVTISQERFLDGGSSSGDGRLWWVPITYTTKSNLDFADTSPAEWLNTTHKVIDGLAVDNDDWLILNVQQTGFYRVNYDATNWGLLHAQLNSDQYAVIPPVNRAQIIDDASSLANDGRLGYDVVVRLWQYLSREMDYIPWSTALPKLTSLDYRIRPCSEYYPTFKAFFLSLIKPVYEYLGFDEKPTDDHVTKLLRGQIVSQVCALGYEPCLQEAVSKFKDFLTDQEKNKVAPDLQETVYCYGLQASGYDAYATLRRLYLTTNIISEKIVLEGVLTCSGNYTAYEEFLTTTFTSRNFFKAQDYHTSSLLNSPKGVDLYISFLTMNYKDLTQLLNSTRRALRMVDTVADYISTQEQYIKLEQFLNDHKEELNFTGEAATYLDSVNRRFASAQTLGAELARAIKQTYQLSSLVSPQSYQPNEGAQIEDTDRMELYANDVIIDGPSVDVMPQSGRRHMTNAKN